MKAIKVNRTQLVREMLVTHPDLTPKQIAEQVGCHVTIVHEQRRLALKGKQMKAKKAQPKNAQPKKAGRPSNKDILSAGIADASALLAEIAKSYDLLFNIFDGKVVINKADDEYECKPADVPAVIGSLAYLHTFTKKD